MKLILLTILALYLSSDVVESDCCNQSIVGLCGDCTYGTPCCGYQSCNFFCCACGGGCRSGGGCLKQQLFQNDGPAMSFSEYNVHHLVSMLDRNGDQLVSLDEAEYFLVHYRSANDTADIAVQFKMLDTNLDGFLGFEEIDPPTTKK